MQEVYDRILNDKNAPQGNVQSNLKCALYLVLCLYKINFNDAERAAEEVAEYIRKYTVG